MELERSTYSTRTSAGDLLGLVRRPSWWANARCREPGYSLELFFPERAPGADLAELHAKARQVCAGCAVRVECGDYGANELHGIWGGLNRRERVARRRAAS